MLRIAICDDDRFTCLEMEFAGFDISASSSGATYCRNVVNYDTDIHSNSVLA